MLEGIGLFQLSGDRMRYLSARQTLINRNVANADTPGYRSQDLAPFTPSNTLVQGGQGGAGAAAPLQMSASSAGHFGFGVSGATNAQLDRKMHGYDEKPDQNNVSVEEQMVKANDVANAYDLASVAYRKSVSLIKSALGES